MGELVSPSVVRPAGLRDEVVNKFLDRPEFIATFQNGSAGKGGRVVLFAVFGSAMCPLSCLHLF